MSESTPEIDRTKIRIGLAMLTIVLVAAIVAFFLVDSTIARAAFFALGVVLLVRMGLLVRWARRRA
jgi:FtsH-binding integral membrane protein